MSGTNPKNPPLFYAYYDSDLKEQTVESEITLRDLMLLALVAGGQYWGFRTDNASRDEAATECWLDADALLAGRERARRSESGK